MIALALALAPTLLGDPHSSRNEDPAQEGPVQGGAGQEDQSKQERLSRLRKLYPLPDDFVQYARVPEGGVSPRLGVGRGEVVLLYYKGGDEGGDLFVARTRDEAKSFSPSLRVNPEPGTVACASGAHGGSIDVAQDGSVHVTWTTRDEPRGLRYARLEPGGEPSAPVDLGAPQGLCVSTAVTIDDRGRVLVFYAAGDPAQGAEPDARRVWLRTSRDGVEFSAPAIVDHHGKGVSEQSGMAAHVDEIMGTIFVLYRTAYVLKPDSPSLARGMRLMSSSDAEAFEPAWVDNWRGVRDPRSSASLGQEQSSTLAIWESGGEVFWSVVRRQLRKLEVPIAPRTEGPAVIRTRPSGAEGGGEVLLAWLERPKDAPETPARLAWRVWVRDIRAPIADGFAPEAPQSGSPAVFARAAGGFTVLY